MSTHPESRPMTAEELLEMPDDGYCYELVRGELRKMSPPGGEHGIIAMTVAASLYEAVKRGRLGRVFAAETGFRLARDPDTVRAPDAAFLRAERVEELRGTRGYWPVAPDLVVEVVSPGDSRREVMDTVDGWLEAGCRMVVVVDPRARTVAVYRSWGEVRGLGEEDVLDGEEVVPGWSVPVRELFA